MINALKFVIITAFSGAMAACSKSDDHTINGNPNPVTPPTTKQSYTVDESFSVSFGNMGAETAALQKDGKILVAGTSWLIRLEKDGSLDNTFKPGPEVANWQKIEAFAVQDDGKILVVGVLTLPTGKKGIARLNSNGSLDNSFIGPELLDDYMNKIIDIKCIFIQPDGKIVIGGSFSYKLGNSGRYCLARLTSNGTFDPSFVSPVGANNRSSVAALVALPGGGMVLTGFGAIALNNGNSVNIVKTNASGVYDINYYLDGEIREGSWTSYIRRLALRKDEKVIIAGDYFDIGTSRASGLDVLNADGSLDKSFQFEGHGGGTTTNNLASLLVLPDQGVMVGRRLYLFARTFSNVSHFNPDGSADTTLTLGSAYTDNSVLCMLNQDDNHVLLFGQFTKDGKRYAILRLEKKL